MSIVTKFLKLFEYDPETDGASTFNIPKALNENWDKIDAWASGIKDTIAGLVPSTRTINKKPLSADVTLTGEDIPAGAEDATTLSSHLAECKKALGNKLSVPTAIPKYTNLNALKTPGMYYCGAAMESPNIPPNPLGEGAFALLVESTYAVGVSQSLTWYVSGKTHKRLCTNTNDDEWTDWVPIATATPPEEIPLNLAEGWSGTANYFKTQECICVVELDIVKNTAVSNNEILAALPEGFRPSHARMHPAVVFAPHGSVAIAVHLTGEISIRDISGSPNARNIYATIVYKTAK